MTTNLSIQIACLEYDDINTLLSGLPIGKSIYIERLEDNSYLISRVARCETKHKPEDYWIVDDKPASTVIVSIHEALKEV